jgi:hypothetical protein
MAGDQPVELADVQFEQLPADYLAHAQMIATGCSAGLDIGAGDDDHHRAFAHGGLTGSGP